MLKKFKNFTDLKVDCLPSRQLACVLTLIHAWALLATLSCSLLVVYKILLLFTIPLSLIANLRRYCYLSTPNSCRAIRLLSGSQCQLIYANQTTVTASIRADSLMMADLAILNFTANSFWPTPPVVLLADSLKPGTHRKMRICYTVNIGRSRS